MGSLRTRKVIKLFTRACRICGQYFWHHSANANFCTKACNDQIKVNRAMRWYYKARGTAEGHEKLKAKQRATYHRSREDPVWLAAWREGQRKRAVVYRLRHPLAQHLANHTPEQKELRARRRKMVEAGAELIGTTRHYAEKAGLDAAIYQAVKSILKEDKT
jgi:hypothetical protein